MFMLLFYQLQVRGLELKWGRTLLFGLIMRLITSIIATGLYKVCKHYVGHFCTAVCIRLFNCIVSSVGPPQMLYAAPTHRNAAPMPATLPLLTMHCTTTVRLWQDLDKIDVSLRQNVPFFRKVPPKGLDYAFKIRVSPGVAIAGMCVCICM